MSKLECYVTCVIPFGYTKLCLSVNACAYVLPNVQQNNVWCPLTAVTWDLSLLYGLRFKSYAYGWFSSRVVFGPWEVSSYNSENFILMSKFSEASGSEKKTCVRLNTLHKFLRWQCIFVCIAQIASIKRKLKKEWNFRKRRALKKKHA